MDMWSPYKDTVIDILIDKSHIIKELNRALEDIHRTLQKDMEKESRVSLKNMWFLFLTGNENLTSRQSKQLDILLEAYPQFKTLYYLKEAFRNIYQFAESKENAEKLYADWVQANEDEGCHAFDSFISTVGDWHTEIFNYFDNRYTNTQTENLNNVIREIDRAVRGYNFPLLQAKILYRHITTKKGQFTFKKWA